MCVHCVVKCWCQLKLSKSQRMAESPPPLWRPHSLILSDSWRVSFNFFPDDAAVRQGTSLHDCILTGSNMRSKSERIPCWLPGFHMRRDLSEKSSVSLWGEQKENCVSLFLQHLPASFSCCRGRKRRREMTFSLWNEESDNPQALED